MEVLRAVTDNDGVDALLLDPDTSERESKRLLTHCPAMHGAHL